MFISAASCLFFLFTALTPTSSILPVAGFSMKLIPIDSPESPLYSASATAQERHQRLARISMARTLRCNKDEKKALVDFSTPVQGGLNDVYYYATQLNVGTDAGSLSPYVSVDTVSPETWIQCEGCSTCFNVKGGNFNYKISPSYRPIAYDDKLCVPQTRYQNGNTCGYTASYIRRKMSSSGTVGVDTFFFQDSTGQPGDFFDMAFGCGFQNDDVHFGNDNTNVISGVLGLGAGGPRAFMNQVKDLAKDRFSYCLPLTARANKSTTLFFGDDAQISGFEMQKMAMKAGDAYHLFLEGISVNGSRAPIDPSTFEYHEDGSQGFFIDSGSPYSVLTASAYNPLSDTIIQYFANLGVAPRDDGAPPFDLCFASLPDPEQLAPILTLHLKGGFFLLLQPENVFTRLEGVEGFCMTILWAPNPGPSLFGAWQQANHQFLFDLQHHEISFVRRYDC